MGITRSSRHKRRATGGRMPVHQKKRKFELGRAPAMTKLGAPRIRPVRCRGGNLKYRALRLDSGNFSWGSEGVSRKTRIISVVYNASNNEFVRTNTLMKNTIILVDASPFRQWFLNYYGRDIGKKKKSDQTAEQEAPLTEQQIAEHKKRAHQAKIDPALEDQFNSGRLMACISSRPGQTGRADGYILEGAELQFYKKRIEKKKGK